MHPVQIRIIATNKLSPNHFRLINGGQRKEQYVRAVFNNPVGQVLRQMKWVLGGSLLLVLLVGITIWLLVRALFHEKKIAEHQK